LDKPAKSPYHHLIPEVREQRRRRNWYLLLGLTALVFAWIGYNLWRDSAAIPSPSKGDGALREVIQKSVNAP
jgi:hypothetical protein